ncbi:unnamed protein product [Effrenium voratum]|nr:unnamed protein product [Effrenium voratum]CAJ1460277.1 unnamed protein product [Effrenium voratum]
MDFLAQAWQSAGARERGQIWPGPARPNMRLWVLLLLWAEGDAFCKDRDDRWAVHGSSCKRMANMCDDASYGELVQAWCPVTCGRCKTERLEDFVKSQVREQNMTRMTNQTGNLTCPSNTTMNATRLPKTLGLPWREQRVDRPWSGAEPFAFEVLGKETFSLSVRPEANIMNATYSSTSSASNASNESNVSDGNSSFSTIHAYADAFGHVSVTTEEEKQCPEGWERVIGDVYGGDQFTGGWKHSAESMEDCAWRCLRQPGCGSFEWSETKKKCYRNSQTRPTHTEDRQDFLFCRRQPCPRFKAKEACVGPGIATGYYSKEVNMRPGSYCIWSGGHCQAPMACTDHDCFLPDGGLPGMELPSRYTLWISRPGLRASMGAAGLGLAQ